MLFIFATPLVVGIFWGVLSVLGTAVAVAVLAGLQIVYIWHRRLLVTDEPSRGVKVWETVLTVMVAVAFVGLRAVL